MPKLKLSNLLNAIALSTFLFFAGACENISFQNGIDEGKIEYEISYPEISPDNFMLELLPKRMETTFLDNNYRSDIIAGMGIFKTSIIFNHENDKIVHSIKMLKTKYASELTDEDFASFNPTFNSIEVNLTDETKEIAGYLCNSANVVVQGDSVWNFKVYYTNDIKIEEPNLHTPFRQIKGVLMEYQLLSNNILMNFSATKVIDEKVDKSAIELEEGYEMVEPAKLKAEIKKLFANIM